MKVSSYYNQKKRKEINGPQAAVIKYDEETGKVPVVVAHGKGHVAQQIIELAQEKQYPYARRLCTRGQSLRHGLGG